MAKNSGASRHEALRLQARAKQARARRNGRVLWILAAVVAIGVVVGLAWGVSQAIFRNAPGAAQTMPPNATETFGIMIQTRVTEPAGGVPHLVIYEDPQCQGCASTEELFGPAVLELVDEGMITAEVITAHFVDTQRGNDASERAANAGAAADALGKYREFRAAMFNNQPAEELAADGYTEQQLREEIPALAGIEGDELTSFQELYDARVFAGFVALADEQFARDDVGATPTYRVDGGNLEFYDEAGQPLIEPTAQDLMRAIEEIA